MSQKGNCDHLAGVPRGYRRAGVPRSTGPSPTEAKSFYVALPALPPPCLSNAVNEMAAELDQTATSGGIGAKEEAADTGKMAPAAKKAAHKPRKSASSSVDVRVGSAVRARIHAIREGPQRGLPHHAGRPRPDRADTRSPGRLRHRARHTRRRPGHTERPQAAGPHGVPVAGRRRRDRPHLGRPPSRAGPDTAPARHREEHESIPATTADTSRRHLREASA